MPTETGRDRERAAALTSPVGERRRLDIAGGTPRLTVGRRLDLVELVREQLVRARSVFERLIIGPWYIPPAGSQRRSARQ